MLGELAVGGHDRVLVDEDRSAADAGRAGVDGALVPDLIPEESVPLREALSAKGIDRAADAPRGRARPARDTPTTRYR